MFPEALKNARESLGLSYSEIAKKVDINPVMPSRYENREHSCFCAPSEKTWNKLNTVLFEGGGASDKERSNDEYLNEATVEALVSELKKRGARVVQIEW